MNPPIFIGSSTTKDQENIVKELKTISDVMHAISVERVEVAAYQLKNVSRTWFNQSKVGRDENAPHPSWACVEKAFLGRFFPRKLNEAKVREFLTLKQDSLSVHVYDLKFTQLFHYAPKRLRIYKER